MTQRGLFNEFPVLDVDDTIVLKEISADHVHDFYEYVRHPEVLPFILGAPENLNEALSELNYWRQVFYSKQSICWAIYDNEVGKMIGTCGFNSCSFIHRRAEISYELAYEYWNKSITTKIVKVLTEFAIKKMKMHRIFANLKVTNPASARVLEKNGFEREGMMRDFVIIGGEYHDSYMYAFIAGDEHGL